MTTTQTIILNYLGYERTEDTAYYVAIVNENGPQPIRKADEAEPVSVPGITGDFFSCILMVSATWGTWTECVISEGLTGGEVGTGFTLIEAIEKVQRNFTKHGTKGFDQIVQNLRDNHTPRYRKLTPTPEP